MNVGIRGAITIHVIFHETVWLCPIPLMLMWKLQLQNAKRYICQFIQLGSRCNCFRDCWQPNPYNPQFVGITSKLLLHHRADLNCNNEPTQQYIFDYDMTERLLIELANSYRHTPITMQSSRNPETAGLGFWCMFKFLQMQFQFGCRLNDCLWNRQPSRFTSSNYAVRYEQ